MRPQTTNFGQVPSSITFEVEPLIARARARGTRDGAELAKAQNGLEVVLSEMHSTLATEVIRSTEFDALARGECERAKAQAQEAVQRLVGARTLRDALAHDSATRPVDYSAVKAVMYLSLALVIVIADMAILGEVFTEFFQTDYFKPALEGAPGSKVAWVTLLLTHPLAAFKSEPGLLLLMIAVLAMGMGFKLVRDHLATPVRDSVPRFFRLIRQIGISVFLAMTITVVVSVAYLRFQVPLGIGAAVAGQTTARNEWNQVLSALLGLCLPFISAVYFMKGYDQLSRRVRLLKAWFLCSLTERAEHRASDRLIALEARAKATEASLDQMKSRQQSDELFLLAKSEYRQAYATGLRAAMAEAPSAFEYARSRLVGRIMSEGAP